MRMSALCLLLAACAPIRAQVTAKTLQDTTPDKWLARFRSQWDDSTWGPKGRRRGYMRPLDDSGWKTRMLALQALVAHKDQAIRPLVAALSSDHRPTRVLAAQTLGFFGPKIPADELRHAMAKDADAAVRLYAVDALGMKGGLDPATLSKRKEMERNRDVRRHIAYAMERKRQGVSPAIAATLRKWDAATMDSAKVGKTAPDFELSTIAGKRHRLSDYRGKKAIVLVFVYGDT